MKINSQVKIELSPQQEQVFLGTMLGDGNLHCRGDKQNSFFQTVCTDKDKDYIFWKYRILEPSGIFLRTPQYRPNMSGFGFHPAWRLSSRHLPLFTRYHKLFYPNGNGMKVVPEEVLERLNVLGITVWYMDDGNLSWGGDYADKPTIRFYTYNFSFEENTLLRDWFRNKLNFPFEVEKRRGKYWCLRLGKKVGVERLLTMIRPYAVPCMGRKFNRGLLHV